MGVVVAVASFVIVRGHSSSAGGRGSSAANNSFASFSLSFFLHLPFVPRRQLPC